MGLVKEEGLIGGVVEAFSNWGLQKNLWGL